MIRLARVSTLSRGREGVEVLFPRLQSGRCQGAVFVCHKGAFDHNLTTRRRQRIVAEAGKVWWEGPGHSATRWRG
jgi:hypothetical protein